MMDWQKYIDNLNQNTEEIKNNSKEMRKDLHCIEDRLADRLDSKLEEWREEIRQRDNQHKNNMNEIRSVMESIQDNFGLINKNLDSMSASMRKLAIATRIGILVMLISVFGIWYSVSGNQAEISKQIQQQNVQIQEIQKSIPK